MECDAAYEAGHMAYETHYGRPVNPYESGSREARAWECGYQDACDNDTMALYADWYGY